VETMPEEETSRLPPGYRVDLVGDPCIIILRGPDGAVVARFLRARMRRNVSREGAGMIVEDAEPHGGERGQQFVICPYCRRERGTMERYVHPVGVKIYPVSGTTEVSVDTDGTEIRPTDAADGQHGASVVLRFRCEEGATSGSRSFASRRGSPP
jgi:hypothetical protein